MANTTPNKYALQYLEEVLQKGEETKVELAYEDAFQILVDEIHKLRRQLIELQSNQIIDISNLQTKVEQLEAKIEKEEE